MKQGEIDSHLEQFTHLDVETELLEETKQDGQEVQKTHNVDVLSSVHSEIILEHFLKSPELIPKHFHRSSCVQ